ncbi:U4/U6 small nuclear ribonucleoprotein Prp31 [Agelaius phoeniceus]|uniref:U4/U6 small nuclear ribonucleoprotein Prp31 n=1 Tax=Agelaius phoeniceus TaxID=39638 RepID=UPI0040552F31
MQKIEENIGKQPRAAEVLGPVEAAPEYRVIVDANNLTVEIENELNIIHKFIRDKYSKRFPELESLVPNALDYIRTVKELGNSLDKCKNNENVQQILTNATIMVVSVTASTTQGCKKWGIWANWAREQFQAMAEGLQLHVVSVEAPPGTSGTPESSQELLALALELALVRRGRRRALLEAALAQARGRRRRP